MAKQKKKKVKPCSFIQAPSWYRKKQQIQEEIKRRQNEIDFNNLMDD